MSIDLKQYKKVSEDEQYVHLKHSKGHEIKLAHKALKGNLKNLISELPHYADGGDVKKEDSIFNIPPPPKPFSFSNPDETPPELISSLFQMPTPENYGKETPPDFQPMISKKEPEIKPENINLESMAVPQQAQQMQIPPVSSAAPLEQGLQQAQAGIMQESQALQQKAQAEAKIYQQQQQQQQQLMDNYQSQYNELESERKMLMDDIRNSRIEPKRYINNMSGMEKAGTAIGLLLSGIGAGLSGERNMAMDYLDKQIERDVDAQKANMGKQQNLLSALYHQYGNMQQAANMAKVFYSDLYSSKIAEAAAKSNDPLAKARANQAMADLNLKYGPMIAQNARMNTIYFGNKQGMISAEQAVPEMFQDAGDRNKAFEELKQVREAQSQIKLVSEQMRELGKLRSTSKLANAPFQSRERIKQLEGAIVSKTKEIFGGLSDNEIHIVKDMLPGYFADDKTVDQGVKEMQKMMAAKVHTPVLDSKNINYGKIVDPKSKFKPSR